MGESRKSILTTWASLIDDLNQDELGISSYSRWGPAGATGRPEAMCWISTEWCWTAALSLDLSYSRKQYRRETMEDLRFSGLRKVSESSLPTARQRERTELTPSDVQFKGLTISRNWSRSPSARGHLGEIENIYRLRRCRRGCGSTAPWTRSGAYFEQARFTMRGALDINCLRKAGMELAKRHAGAAGQFLQRLERANRCKSCTATSSRICI